MEGIKERPVGDTFECEGITLQVAAFTDQVDPLAVTQRCKDCYFYRERVGGTPSICLCNEATKTTGFCSGRGDKQLVFFKQVNS